MEKELEKLYAMLESKKMKKRSQKHQNSRKGFKDHRGAVYGIVKPRYKSGKQLSRDSRENPDIYEEILRIGKLVCKIPFSTVYINKDLQCDKHKDGSNVGPSTLISIGDFVGGEICIQENENSENYIVCSAKYQGIQFDGSKLTHFNLPHTGTKYSLVFFNC